MNKTLLTTALMPLVAPQALWVKYRAGQLCEAAGPREGQTGSGPPLRLLILGDSSAAGVGVAQQDEALAGHVTRMLSVHFTVDWRVLARCGDTTGKALRRLQAEPARPYDVAVIALGVNDAKNGHPRCSFERNYSAILRHLQQTCGVQHIVMSGLPRLEEFQLLPQPLRTILAARTAFFDSLLAQMAQDHTGTYHLGFDDPLDPRDMASDGFHPGPRLYEKWGRWVARDVMRAIQP